MNFQRRRLTDLRVYSNNPRDNTEAVPKVKESIKRYGYKVPIVVDQDNIIVAGHTRFAALLQINEETGQYAEITVVLADDLEDDELQQFRIVDNQVAGLAKWDFTALKLELAGMDDFVLEDFGLIPGFDTELILPDPEPEANAATDAVKFAIGDNKFEMSEMDYHAWCSWVIDTHGVSVLEYVRRQLCIDPTDRIYNGEVPTSI